MALTCDDKRKEERCERRREGVVMRVFRDHDGTKKERCERREEKAGAR